MDDSSTVYLRIERQVVAPIDKRLSIFLIHVYVYDVAELEPRSVRVCHTTSCR